MHQTHYFGTKEIKAVPMTRQEYNDYRGWTLPADEDGSDAGYLVEYIDGGKSNHPSHAGYISWSPSAVFDAAYQANGALTFGHAIEAMTQGHKVARSGWNGRGMWVALAGARNTTKQVPVDSLGCPAVADDAHKQGVSHVSVLPHFIMRTASGEYVVGWLASQTDISATDWAIVE
jgi:hypothetical protein